MVLHPGVQFKPVESDTLPTDRNTCEELPKLGIEAITIHTEVEGRVAQTNEPR